MNRFDIGIDNFGAFFHQAVDGAVDGFFVSGMGWEESTTVSPSWIEKRRLVPLARRPMIEVGSPCVRSPAKQLCSLSSRERHQAKPLTLVILQVAKFFGDSRVFNHAETVETNFAVVAFGSVEHLLRMREIRLEGGNDDASFGLLENAVKSSVDDLFRRRPTRSFRVGGISQKRQNTTAGKLCQFAVIELADRRPGVWSNL